MILPPRAGGDKGKSEKRKGLSEGKPIRLADPWWCSGRRCRKCLCQHRGESWWVEVLRREAQRITLLCEDVIGPLSSSQ